MSCFSCPPCPPCPSPLVSSYTGYYADDLFPTTGAQVVEYLTAAGSTGAPYVLDGNGQVWKLTGTTNPSYELVNTSCVPCFTFYPANRPLLGLLAVRGGPCKNQVTVAGF